MPQLHRDAGMIDWKKLAEDEAKKAVRLPRDVAADVEQLPHDAQVVFYSWFSTLVGRDVDVDEAAKRALETARSSMRIREAAQRRPRRPRRRGSIAYGNLIKDSDAWNPDTLANALRRERSEILEEEKVMTLRENLIKALGLRAGASVTEIVESVERMLADELTPEEKAAAEHRSADPRAQLAGLAEKRAVEKGLEYMKALGEVKHEHPDLVEAVASRYATTR